MSSPYAHEYVDAKHNTATTNAATIRIPSHLAMESPCDGSETSGGEVGLTILNYEPRASASRFSPG